MYKNTDARFFVLDIDDAITERQRMAESAALLTKDYWANQYFADTTALLEELRMTRLLFQEAFNLGLMLSDLEDLDDEEVNSICMRLNEMCGNPIPNVDCNGRPKYLE